MGTYAEVDDVRSRIGGRDIDGSSDPTESAVEAMIEEAESELNGHIAMVGVAPALLSVSTQRGLRGRVADYVKGLVLDSHAGAGGDGSNDDGEQEIQNWRDWLKDIRDNPATWAAIFSAGSTPSTATNFRAYNTDNEDGLSIADGDFDPVITRTETF